MYPVFLDLAGKTCLIAGGGKVASRKIGPLMKTGALVTVVSPEAVDKIRESAEACLIKWEKRHYNKGEAGEYFLAIAATGNREVNRQVGEDAVAAGRLVNVVDMPALCNFFVPSVIGRGELRIALSTSGACPALTKKLREDLERQFPPSYGDLLLLLRGFREKLIASIENEDEKKAVLEKVIASNELIRFLEGDQAPLKELLERCI